MGAVSEPAGQRAGKNEKSGTSTEKGTNRKKGAAGSGGTGGPRRGPAPRGARASAKVNAADSSKGGATRRNVAKNTAGKEAKPATKSATTKPAATDGAATDGASANGGDGWGVWPVALGPRVAVYLGLALLGVLTAAAGALVQSAWSPAGLLLALAGAVGLFWGGAKLCRTKIGAAAPGGTWTVTVLLMTASRPEGDFLFAAGIGSYVYLFGGILAAVMCTTVALPAPPVPANKYR